MGTPCHRAITGIAVFFVSVAATRLELFSRFCVCALPNFALASRNEKCLFGTEATLLDGGADPFAQFGGRISKKSCNGFFTHKLPPSDAVPLRYHNLFNLIPRKVQEA